MKKNYSLRNAPLLMAIFMFLNGVVLAFREPIASAGFWVAGSIFYLTHRLEWGKK